MRASPTHPSVEPVETKAPDDAAQPRRRLAGVSTSSTSGASVELVEIP
jgi:hypothetical protein